MWLSSATRCVVSSLIVMDTQSHDLCEISELCRQMTDAESDEEKGSQCSPQLASRQPLHVLPFYSLLSSDRQAKVCTTSRALLFS